MAGEAAVRRAVDGMNGFMITIARHLDPNKPYSSLIGMVRLRLGAHSEKEVPEAFINEAGNFITEAFEKYAVPLIGGRLPATLEPDPIGEEVRLEPIPVPIHRGESEKGMLLTMSMFREHWIGGLVTYSFFFCDFTWGSPCRCVHFSNNQPTGIQRFPSIR